MRSLREHGVADAAIIGRIERSPVGKIVVSATA